MLLVCWHFSQGSAAMLLRSGGVFNDYFITRLLLSPKVKKMKIGQHLAKLLACFCPVFWLTGIFNNNFNFFSVNFLTISIIFIIIPPPPGLCAIGCNPGQVVNTRASVTKPYNLVPANGRWCLAAGKVTVGLASQATDNSGITTYGLMALEREMSTPPIPSMSVAQFTLPHRAEALSSDDACLTSVCLTSVCRVHRA